MTIYKISDFEESQEYGSSEAFYKKFKQSSSKRELLSTIGARCFFFLLLVADIFWFFYVAVKLALCILGLVFTLSSTAMKKKVLKSYLDFKRSLVCMLALVAAIFSPSLGIMFACMYFLIYDKEGIDEVVPSALKSEFKELFQF